MFTIHGWSFDKSVWRNTEFEKFHHFELPGHGESPFKETDLEKLAFEMGEVVSGGTVVGWSIGATVALLLAFYFPAKIERLVLFSPTPSFCKVSQNPIVCKNFLRKLRRDYERTVKWFRKECRFDGDVPLPEKEKAITLLESFMKLDISDILPKINVPVSIYVGQKDKITTLQGAFQVFRYLPKATLKVYPGKEHYIFGGI
ncbi:alpha/beta fold hydrolase [Desulfurobacterium atlanticum]|uniref:Pimeloyl-[acyl-carrier protein] methyl ester esterase n=1 Tax=Desulfurobacterium atlanticum TaxID=240169 RepID=A0A239A3Z5_9BACT|nr:alpha/beta hydrolase [Desulfurobacterium atlanticum]SNR90209.1 pimeloyl-[acyl-carrier protein] methyl ester esterase [Desulfurobacterium atlanticum]